MPDPNDVAAALTALETALDAFSPPLTLTEQPLAEIDLGAPEPLEPAARAEGIEDALEAAIEKLGEALGEL